MIVNLNLKCNCKKVRKQKEVKTSYKHLTLEERYYKEAGYKQNEIAKKIGVNHSTISREPKKNSTKVYRRYTAKKAIDIENETIRIMSQLKPSHLTMDLSLPTIRAYREFATVILIHLERED
jgi:IS30 family transposase